VYNLVATAGAIATQFPNRIGGNTDLGIVPEGAQRDLGFVYQPVSNLSVGLISGGFTSPTRSSRS
jgi:hypothetical protein